MSYQQLKTVYKLKAGQWVWLQEREREPAAVGEVVKVTNTQVHIVRLNQYGTGSVKKFHRLDGQRYSAGDEQGSHWNSDHIHSIATPQEVTQAKRKVTAANRAERQQEARKEATERHVDQLRSFFPKNANLRVGSMTEDGTATYNLHISGLSTEQLIELSNRLCGGIHRSVGFVFPEAE